MSTTIGYSQGQLEGKELTKEFLFGISINNHGGLPSGLLLRYGQYKNKKTTVTYGLEYSGIRHPREQKVTNDRYNGSPFTYGKENYLICFRPQYGRERLLFRKADDGGVQVRALVTAGPSIGFVVPYQIWYNVSQNGQDFKEMFYKPKELDSSRIYGKGSFFAGLSDADLVMGAHLKLGLSFEMSAFRRTITGLEIGTMYEHFSKKIIILNDPVGVENYNHFTTIYLMFFLGGKR